MTEFLNGMPIIKTDNQTLSSKEKYIKESSGKLEGLPFVSTRLGIDNYIYSDKEIKTAYGAVSLVSEYLYDQAKENCLAIYMDSGNTPICVARIGEGSEKESTMSARDVVQIGLLLNASNVMIIHNHPALIADKRHLRPSEADIRITDVMARACSLVGITLLDSIVVAGYKERFGIRTPAYYSMKEHNFKKLAYKVGPFIDKDETKEENIRFNIDAKKHWSENGLIEDQTISHIDNIEVLPSKIEEKEDIEDYGDR